MRKKLWTVIFYFLMTAGAAAQVSTYYDWKKTPVYASTPDDSTSSTVGLKDRRALEFYYDPAKSDDLLAYYSRHVIVRLNSTDALESFNKIYIPVSDVIDVVKVKARSVSKEGKVNELNKNDIKASENVEEEGDYRYFAMEGLEVGSIVEYLYVINIDAQVYDDEFLQSEYPKYDVTYDVYAPENLTYLFKSYNGLPQMEKDSNLTDSHHWFLKIDKMKGLQEERYAGYYSNMMRVEYTLAYNAASGNKRLLDWARASETFFSFYTETETKPLAAAEKFLKKMEVQGSNDKEKVFYLDNWLKSHVSSQNVMDPDLSDLSKIISNMAANDAGIIKLYGALLNAMGLATEIVITTDRNNKKFDGEFETWSYLDHVMLYVPSLHLYVTPTEYSNRNGMPPAEWSDNDGLFIKKVTVGDFTSGIGKVKHIPAADYLLNKDDIYADVQFTSGMEEVNVKVKRVVSGHSAEFVQSYYEFLNEDEERELMDPIIKFMGEDSKITDYSVTNQLEDLASPDHPFVIEAEITLSSLLEKAGNNYLFKIGNIIGEQVEMYSEKERQLPVENEWNRRFYREITFIIPDGYQVKNPEALNINVVLNEGSEQNFYFKSSYTIDGSKVKVTIDEVYRKIRLPIEFYEDFRKVINAAADFNKVVLVLEKMN